MKAQVIEKTLLPSSSFKRGGWFVFLYLLLMASNQMLAVCLPQEAEKQSSDAATNQSTEKIYISGGAVLFVAEGTTVHNAELIEAENPEVNTHKKAAHRTVLQKQAEKKLKRKSDVPKQPSTTEFIRQKPYSHTLYAGTVANQKLTISVKQYISFFRPFKYRETQLIVSSLDVSPLLIQSHCYSILEVSQLFQRPPPSCTL